MPMIRPRMHKRIRVKIEGSKTKYVATGRPIALRHLQEQERYFPILKGLLRQRVKMVKKGENDSIVLEGLSSSVLNSPFVASISAAIPAKGRH